MMAKTDETATMDKIIGCTLRLEYVRESAVLNRVQCGQCVFYRHDENGVDWCDLQDVSVDPYGWCYRFWDKEVRHGW